MKIIVISDLHIPYTAKEFISFLTYILLYADIVVLNGDIIDKARVELKDIVFPPQGKELIIALRKLIENKQVYFIAGNHDPDIADYIKKLFNLDVVQFDILKIGNITFTHGYQFDFINAYLPWKFLSKIAHIFFKTPSEWKQKKREKWQKQIGTVYANAISWLEEHRDIEMLVIGHTHYPCIQHLETGQILTDSGDWGDSLSWLEIDTETGDVKLKTWRSLENNSRSINKV